MSIVAWLKRLTRRHLDDEDFKEEIEAHLAIATEERMADGEDRDAARYAALRDFGNVTLTTEAARRVWTPGWLEVLRDLASDARYAVRTLAKHPVFSLTVVGVLTLGIGLNATVFTMLKSLALDPLAGVANSASMAVIYGETTTGRQVRVSYPDYVYLRDRNQSFSSLMGSTYVQANLGRGRGARQVSVELVTGNYFQFLGVSAQLGRTLLPTDEVAPGGHPVVVISDGLWRRDFAAAPDIVGRTLEINNYRLTIVGVADAAFHGTIVSYDVEAFMPVMMAAEIGVFGGRPRSSAAVLLADRRAGLLFPHGRLRPGISLASAGAEIDAMSATLSSDRLPTDPAQPLHVTPFWRSPTGGQSYVLPTLTVLSAMGLLVLIIACANIAGLVLVRGLSRRGEIAVRLALGAARRRIVRLLVIENLVLAIPGAILGVALAQYAVPALVDYAAWLAAPQRIFFNIGVDRLVIGFTVLIACGCAMVFGFVPALQSSRVDLVAVINEDGSPRGAARGRLRSVLVVAQVAVSLLLLVAAGLVGRSLDAARRANPGFEPQQVASVAMDLQQNAYDEARGRVFYRHLLEAMRSDAAIESVTLAAYSPLGFLDTRATRAAIEGYEPRRGEDMSFMSNTIAPDYFRTLRIPLLAGRPFDDRDDETGGPVVIVNETFSRRFLGGVGSALGRRVRIAEGDWRAVVGVVADVKYSRVDEGPRPYFYVPLFQAYRSSMVLHARGAAPVDVLVDTSRAHVAALDADLPLLYARPLTEMLKGALIFLRLTAMMLSIFGAAGLALAAMGTYGLVSYTVRQSTHEIGIRMALGASTLSIVRGFVGRGLRLGAIGALTGTVAAFGVNRMLESVLFGVTATDATSFARALGVVIGGVIIATLLPARRAARIDPLQALRHQ